MDGNEKTSLSENPPSLLLVSETEIDDIKKNVNSKGNLCFK